MTRDQLAEAAAAVLRVGGTVSFPYKTRWSDEVVRVEAYRRDHLAADWPAAVG